VSTLFKRIDTVFLHVKQFDQAIEWYVQKLGFTLRWRHDEGGYAALNIGETPLTLVRAVDGVGQHRFGRESFRSLPFSGVILDVRSYIHNHKKGLGKRRILFSWRKILSCWLIIICFI
jgi:catechol 2,3-dioxygenase-like lactoylglutathione lyase family enzyme